LQRKAREGVQVFVIVYKEVSNDFTPVDSTYTKTRLRGLHPNIHVQRSPSHTSTGTLLWSHVRLSSSFSPCSSSLYLGKPRADPLGPSLPPLPRSQHEKMCVIDETIGFMGGLDLCFGRWDTPGHVLTDDGPNPLKDGVDGKKVSDDEAAKAQIWPGKDYSNQRVLDFHTLNKPEEDMYDRSKVPRQPWCVPLSLPPIAPSRSLAQQARADSHSRHARRHDIGLQIIGQPARDLCRHFMQRWNYLLRTKNHTVKMPFLIPAPDFTPEQLQSQRITGTCEVQICRSVGPWSMGISHVEHSIQNAYIKSIQLSDHFVYIEVRSLPLVVLTLARGGRADSLSLLLPPPRSSLPAEPVLHQQQRVRGYHHREQDRRRARVAHHPRSHRGYALARHDRRPAHPWLCVALSLPFLLLLLLELTPPLRTNTDPYPLDHSEASSVRLIMECQFRTICRGEHSIFARLRREGIDPDEYITFFGLRAWGKLSNGALTTESVRPPRSSSSTVRSSSLADSPSFFPFLFLPFLPFLFLFLSLLSLFPSPSHSLPLALALSLRLLDPSLAALPRPPFRPTSTPRA